MVEGLYGQCQIFGAKLAITTYGKVQQVRTDAIKRFCDIGKNSSEVDDSFGICITTKQMIDNGQYQKNDEIAERMAQINELRANFIKTYQNDMLKGYYDVYIEYCEKMKNQFEQFEEYVKDTFYSKRPADEIYEDYETLRDAIKNLSDELNNWSQDYVSKINTSFKAWATDVENIYEEMKALDKEIYKYKSDNSWWDFWDNICPQLSSAETKFQQDLQGLKEVLATRE